MIKIENEDIVYKQLLVIDSDEHTCSTLGVRDDGALLLINEKEKLAGNARCMNREFFAIDGDEYLECLAIAARNVCLQRSISNRETILEVLYGGIWFAVGSSIKYIVNHNETSIFTGDHELAEAMGFDRVDKFEYEKTVHIEDCESVRISHCDEDGDLVMQCEIEPARFAAWAITAR